MCFQIKTTAFLMNYRALGQSVAVPGLICLAALCFFMLVQCILCYFRSIPSDFGSCYKALDLTIIVLSLAGVCLYLLGSACLSQSIKMIEKEDHNKLFDFKVMELLDALMIIYVVFLVCLSIVRGLILLLND
jgi:hypothetical protein